jgi:hypothetical protein
MKDFTLYPEALELKELGFDESCFAWYHLGDTLLSDITMGYEKTDFLYTQDDMEETQCTAPTYSQAFRWFREKHLLEGLVLPQDKSVPDPLPIYFIAVISYEDGGMNELFNSTSPINTLHYSEYEEAQLECLRHLIKIVKENEKQI